MPIAERNAEVNWDGPLSTGTGTLSSGSGALTGLVVTWASRTEEPRGKTSPEELIAAAHASCFAMALALTLGENKASPERLQVSAACTLDEVEDAPTITAIDLFVRARISDLDQTEFERVVQRAESLCPVSNALRGNVAITIRHQLEGG